MVICLPGLAVSKPVWQISYLSFLPRPFPVRISSDYSAVSLISGSSSFGCCVIIIIPAFSSMYYNSSRWEAKKANGHHKVWFFNFVLLAHFGTFLVEDGHKERKRESHLNIERERNGTLLFRRLFSMPWSGYVCLILSSIFFTVWSVSQWSIDSFCSIIKMKTTKSAYFE